MALDINDQYDKIYRFCYLKLKNRDLAEDVTQETFLRYLEHPQYNSIDKTLQILYTIAGNLCIDEFRRRPTDELPEDASSGTDMEDDVLSSLALRQALDKVPNVYKEMLLLRYINDVPVGVLSKMYGMSRFSVNRRLKSVLASLRSELGKEELE